MTIQKMKLFDTRVYVYRSLNMKRYVYDLIAGWVPAGVCYGEVHRIAADQTYEFEFSSRLIPR